MNMKKSMIALAVASAFVAPAVMAEATVYGQANMSYDITDNGNAADSGAMMVSSNSSRVGVKGSEDLGDGLSVVFQMEGTVAMDTGGSGLFDRNTYLGLSSTDLGTVLAGHHDTPYKTSTRGLDQFADTIADNRGLMGTSILPMFSAAMSSHDIRADDVLLYRSTDMGGMSVAAAYVGDEVADSTDETGYSLAGMYNADGIYATVAYQSFDSSDSLNPAADTTDTALKFGGGYTMDAFSVGLVYEMIEHELVGNTLSQNNLYVAGKYNVTDKGAVKLAYTMADDAEDNTGASADSGATQISVGYDHSLSKNTTVYALYTSLENGLNSGGYGAIGTETTAGPITPPANESATSISIGVKHAF